MSQPQPPVFTWEQAIESLAEILIKDKLSTDPRWKGELSDGLKDFAARYCELSLKGTKRTKTEAGATNFTVHAKGPYTVRVFEGDIPVGEFSSSTPATVQVKITQKSAASAAAVIDLDESDN
ncbi:hypothetical protein B0T13DRAFT_512934 [Neurospora crassa]|nr:hypothetical protein B0T13DRAFT_512934 [Neurospora crassa]